MQKPWWQRELSLKFYLKDKAGLRQEYGAAVVLTTDQLVRGRVCPEFLGSRAEERLEAETKDPETPELVALAVGETVAELLSEEKSRASVAEVTVHKGEFNSASAYWD